jgi:hypothetical protein
MVIVARERDRPMDLEDADNNDKFQVVVMVYGETSCFLVSPEDTRWLPDKVWWSRNSRNWAVGPDGAPLGLWGSQEFTAREVLPGGCLGPERRFAVGDLTEIERFATSSLDYWLNDERPQSPSVGEGQGR